MKTIILNPTTTDNTFWMVKESVLYKEEELERISQIIVGVVGLEITKVSFVTEKETTIMTTLHSIIN